MPKTTKQAKPHNLNTKLQKELDNVKVAVLAVNLSNQTDPQDLEDVKTQLTKQLEQSGDQIIQLIPFYKLGVTHYTDGSVIPPAGYVIETQKEIIVAYHGTQPEQWYGSGAIELFHAIQIHQAPMQFGNQQGDVYAGFKKEYEASKAQLKIALLQVNLTKPFVISGHSLGGAVAQIAALDITTNGINNFTPDSQTKSSQLKQPSQINIDIIIVFGSPRGFYKTAAKIFKDTKLDTKTLRIENTWDPITKFPPESFLPFEHVGKKCELPSTFWNQHSVNTYTHIVSQLTVETLQGAMQNTSDIQLYQQSSINHYASIVKNIGVQMWNIIRP